MITKTVGSGGDYATVRDAWYAYSNVSLPGGLTDHITYNQISDTNETVAISNSGYVITNGYGVTFNGNGFTINTNGQLCFVCSSSGAGTVDIGEFKVKRTTPLTQHVLRVGNSPYGAGYYNSAITYKLHDVVFDGGGIGALTADRSCIATSDTHSIIKLYNLKIHNANTGLSTQVIDGNEGNPRSGDYTIENCSVYNCRLGVFLYANAIPAFYVTFPVMKNIVSAGCTTDWSTETNHTITYCASSDATVKSGTGNVSSITPADEFVSTDPSSIDFLKLKRTGTIYRLGTAPTLTSTDIAGKAIPDAFGCYPIGCHVGERTGLPIDITCGFLNIGDSRV